jgi:preprotein translocase subunit SecF
VPFEIIKSGTHIDFIGRWKLCAGFSVAILLAGAIAIPLRGIRLGLDFSGGTEVQLRFEPGVQVDEGAIRPVLTACGVQEPDVVRYGETDTPEFLIRFQAESAAPEGGPGEASAGCPLSEQDLARLREAAGETGRAGSEEGAGSGVGEIVDRIDLALHNAVGPHTVERVEFVGPRVGADLRRGAMYALLVSWALILVYVGFRFNTRFSPGCVAALIHDVLITAAIFVILGMAFDLQVLAALLTIVGYSVNDTVIIYDRIREATAIRTKHDLAEVMNRAINETLSRTILTVATVLIAVLALLFLGGRTIFPFSFAMLIGCLVGAYSSIYIAAPITLFLERRYGNAT